MGTLGTALINGQWAFVDSDAPSTALGYLSAAAGGGGVLFHVSEFIVLNGTVLSAITDAGSGVVISAAERAGLHGHTNQSTLDQLIAPTAGQIGYIRTATATGVEGWMAAPATSVNDQGWWANLAALKVAIPSGTAGWYATLINSGSPATVAVWDADAGPADWVEIGVASVTSVDPGDGAQTGAVVFDADNITEGATNLWLTAAERASVATIAAMTVTIGTNTTLATHANIAILNGISSAGSGIIATTAEHTTIADLTSPATPADDDKVWTATAGTGGWTTFVPGGAGTVTSVNTILPTAGNVTLTMDNMAEGTNKILTQAERTSIVNTAGVSASNASALTVLEGQQTLTYADPLPFNRAGGRSGVVTLTGSPTLSEPTNITAGQELVYVVIQGTAGNTVTWPASFVWSDGIAIQPDATIGATSIFGFYVNSVGEIINTGYQLKVS